MKFSDKAAAWSVAIGGVLGLLAGIYVHWIAGVVVFVLVGGGLYQAIISQKAAENLANGRK